MDLDIIKMIIRIIRIIIGIIKAIRIKMITTPRGRKIWTQPTGKIIIIPIGNSTYYRTHFKNCILIIKNNKSIIPTKLWILWPKMITRMIF